MHGDTVNVEQVPLVVAGFLRLLARQSEISAATIADVVMFAAGEKSAVRFAVSAGVRAELDRWASSFGLAAESRTVGLKRVADWICIGVDKSSATAHLDVVVYAKSQKDASMICEIEASGNAVQAGLLLGYPHVALRLTKAIAKNPPTGYARRLPEAALARSRAGRIAFR